MRKNKLQFFLDFCKHECDWKKFFFFELRFSSSFYAFHIPLPQSKILCRIACSVFRKKRGWESISFCLFRNFSLTVAKILILLQSQLCRAMCKQSNRRTVFNMCLWMCQLLLLIHSNNFCWCCCWYRSGSRNYFYWRDK